MKFVYHFRLLCKLYCKYTQLRHLGFKKEVERRSNLDLFDYKGVAQALPKCYFEPCTDNNCFGIGWSIRNYAGSKRNHIDALVEHGYFFGKYVEEQEVNTYSNKILTFGEVRKKHIEKVINNKRVILIGPYIHYAPHFCTPEKLASIKKQLGRVLLVFFSHSGTGCSVSFDVDFIVSKINSIRTDFDSVVVSIFWSDINEELENRMKKEGYIIFSSGHRYDFYFLARQKSVIALADMTMSNFVGTHIAYCTYMNKPHWIVKQDISEIALTEKGAANKALDEEMRMDPENQKEINDFYETFGYYSTNLTDNQKKLASYYFGFNYVRDKQEMIDLLKL